MKECVVSYVTFNAHDIGVVTNSVWQTIEYAKKLDIVLSVSPHDIGLNKAALELTKDVRCSLDTTTLQHFRLHFGYENMPYRTSCDLYSKWTLDIIKHNTKALSQLLDRYDYGTGNFTDGSKKPEVTIGAHVLKSCGML